MSRQSLARATDHATSHVAATKAARFIWNHETAILGALWRPMIASELAKLTAMSVEQVCRRLPELEKAGKVRLTGAERPNAGGNGMREWERVLP